MRKFDGGRLLATPGALAAFEATGERPERFLARHFAGDWGDVDESDEIANNEALKDGSRLLSAYELRNGTRVWVITEADRSATTILLPEEY